LPTTPTFDVLVGGPRWNIVMHNNWYRKLERCGYTPPDGGKKWRYVYSFRQNTETGRTDRRTDRQTDGHRATG